MKNGLYLAMLAAGGAVGVMAAWYFAKKKYERIAQEEIDSVKEAFSRRESHTCDEETRKAADQAKEKPDMAEYTALLRKEKYAANEEKDVGIVDDNHPYVISPEEFGEFEDYEEIILVYYRDGVLADDDNELVDDIEDTVGDALNHFGEYEDDSVFVRCDERKCDYEILLDQRRFSEVIADMPRQVSL